MPKEFVLRSEKQDRKAQKKNPNALGHGYFIVLYTASHPPPQKTTQSKNGYGKGARTSPRGQGERKRQSEVKGGRPHPLQAEKPKRDPQIIIIQRARRASDPRLTDTVIIHSALL